MSQKYPFQGGVRKTHRHAPTGNQFYAARRTEKQRDTAGGRYRTTRFPYPNQTEFGKRGEWTDAYGRHYRIATKTHPSQWTPGVMIPLPSHEERQRLLTTVTPGGLAFWIKVPHRGDPNAWFTLAERQNRLTLSLHPIRDGVPPITLQLFGPQEHGKKNDGRGRTGQIKVTLLV